MTTAQKQILAKIPTPPPGAVFRLVKIDTVVLPHPFHIGARHLSNSQGGVLDPDAAPCAYPGGCNLNAAQHEKQTTLFIRVPSNRDLNAVEGLHDYLKSIKEAAEAVGIQGFAFPDRDPWKDTTARITGEGSGCFMDPPSYPTHFYSIATGKGRNSGCMSLDSALDEEEAEHLPDAVLDRVRQLITDWQTTRPALDSPRALAWMADCYAHFKSCYVDDHQIAEPFEYDKPATIIYPVPSYKLKHFHDDPRFSEEWRTKEKAAIEQANNEILAAYAKVAIPDNHQAVRFIRKFYPEHQPRLDWIGTAPQNPGHWYKTLDAPPTPENCPGERGIGKHPVNGSWCQFCGWHEDVKAA